MKRAICGVSNTCTEQHFDKCKSHWQTTKTPIINDPQKCMSQPFVSLRGIQYQPLKEDVKELVHDPTYCKSENNADCDCCAAPGQGSCKAGSKFQSLNTACWTSSLGDGNFPLDFLSCKSESGRCWSSPIINTKCSQRTDKGSGHTETQCKAKCTGSCDSIQFKSGRCYICTGGAAKRVPGSAKWYSVITREPSSYKQRYSCLVEKNYDIYDPTYSSGLLTSNSIYNGNPIGSMHGRGRLSDDEMCWSAAKNQPGSVWWQISSPQPRKILGFAVKDRKDRSQFVKKWKLSYLTNGGSFASVQSTTCSYSKRMYSYWGVYYGSITAPHPESYSFYAHNSAADRNKQFDILFHTPIVTSALRFYPQTYESHMSASLALLVEKDEKAENSIPSLIPQFGLKFKGHINIERKGRYTFKVFTSHPFQLAVNHVGIISQLQAGTAEGIIQFDKIGFVPIKANFFYYGQKFVAKTVHQGKCNTEKSCNIAGRPVKVAIGYTAMCRCVNRDNSQGTSICGKMTFETCKSECIAKNKVIPSSVPGIIAARGTGCGTDKLEMWVYVVGVSDRPSLDMHVQFNDGPFRPVYAGDINTVGKPTNPPCPTSINTMRETMRTTNTSNALERVCSLRELLLPVTLQWATSYQIFAMAHDRMPSSFQSAVGFGEERSCARRFCYAETVDGPDIQLSMIAVDGQSLLGRIKNAEYPAIVSFPSDVLFQGSSYHLMFNLDGLSLSTEDAIANTASTM